MPSKTIEETISLLPNGYVFTPSEIRIGKMSVKYIQQVLNKMVDEGKLRQLCKGRYYRPVYTILGEAQPDIEQVVKDFLYSKNTITGYVSGYVLFERLGLTTQNATNIQIARQGRKQPVHRGEFVILFINQPNRITKDNYRLLQLLDCIRFIKDIPDTTIDESVRRISSHIANLSQQECVTIQNLAKNYAPIVRALLGAILEQVQPTIKTDTLRNTLSPFTTYQLGLTDDNLISAKQWKIK